MYRGTATAVVGAVLCGSERASERTGCNSPWPTDSQGDLAADVVEVALGTGYAGYTVAAGSMHGAHEISYPDHKSHYALQVYI